MKAYLKPKEEYIYKDCTVRMSKSRLADIMYAAIMTNTALPLFYAQGCYGYNRSQNAYNYASVKVHIHPDNIEQFESLAGLELRNPVTVRLN